MSTEAVSDQPPSDAELHNPYRPGGIYEFGDPSEAPPQPVEISDEQLLLKAIELREWLKASAEAQELYVKSTQEALEQVKGEMHRRLITRFGTAIGKKKNSACDAGTFYTSATLSVRVSDPIAFKAFVFQNQAFDYIAASANTDPVEAYLDAYKMPPPGVEATWVEKINFRRK